LTLTVPQNALTETVAFSIQPITNKSEGGLGLAYRLEPNGQTFATPVEITFKYTNGDLEGTAAEFLGAAYQDRERRWNILNSIHVDRPSGTLTASTNHFTDWAFLKTLYILPQKATLRVGESLEMELRGCELRSGFGGWLYRKDSTCWVRDRVEHNDWPIRGNWFTDNGSIDEPSKIRIRYTAPPTKPNPNPVTVSLTSDPAAEDRVPSHRVMWTSQITIIDRGYRASGGGGEVVFSGDICDLEKDFTIKHNHPFITPYKFVPSSPTEGTWSFSWQNGFTGGGAGKYTITGTDTEKTGIELTGGNSKTLHGKTSGGPVDIHLDLVPLDKECKP